jgi:glycosyltransferase involved in cell wall biosynthesis
MDAERAMNVDIIVPVHNQARTLERQISGLYAHLKSRFPYRWKLLLVDHGSTDGGFWEARKLEERYSGVQAVQVALEGRGRALKRGSQGLGDVFCYLDAANLPKDLEDITRLVGLVAEDLCDVAAGRWFPGGAGWDGRFVSGLYHLGLKLAVNLPVTDAQCPFKAVSRRVAVEIVPQVRDEFWFFDTELLVLAQARGCRIKQTVISRERPDRAAIEEPLPELMRRILDLRQRLRGTAANPADRDPRTGAEVSPQEGRRTHAQDQGEPR